MGKCQLCDVETKGKSPLCSECEILRAQIKQRGRDMVIQTVRTNLESDDVPDATQDPRFSTSAVSLIN